MSRLSDPLCDFDIGISVSLSLSLLSLSEMVLGNCIDNLKFKKL